MIKDPCKSHKQWPQNLLKLLKFVEKQTSSQVFAIYISAFSITKECYNNGTWGEHNLSECVEWDETRKYWKEAMELHIHISSILSVCLSAFSIAFLLASMGIFLCFYR